MIKLKMLNFIKAKEYYIDAERYINLLHSINHITISEAEELKRFASKYYYNKKVNAYEREVNMH